MKNKNSVKLISLFDIIGPVMIGPSSSHTLGAAKIGLHAYKLLNEEPKKITIQLFNSFSATGKGHKTDIAILGGCMGITPDDEQLKNAVQIAKERNIEVQIHWKGNNPLFHPNTAVVELTGDTAHIEIAGYSVGGGRTDVIENLAEHIPYKKGLVVSATYPSLSEIMTQISSPKEAVTYILKKESEHAQLTDQAMQEMLTEIWHTMKEAVIKGINDVSKSESGLSGGDAQKLASSSSLLMNSLFSDSLAYSVAVAEYNAKMGKIVACPTAGSCGIIPGILVSLQKHRGISDKSITDALVISGLIGLTVARQVELAGAVAGCQAEIGVAGAMAAAAAVFVLGGSLAEIESAASLVLGNTLGLTCDPVGGLVEVPCIHRNATITSLVWGAVHMAQSHILYPIPFDEVVTVMKEVGHDMKEKYRETSLGGLAQTPSACRMCKRCG
jgi:L-serine dehydratase